MFIFLRLLLGHFIGDYLLQFNAVYSLKLKYPGIKGSVVHTLLVAASIIACVWPFLNLPDLWILLLLISMTHLLQDSFKVSFGKIKYSLWLYLIDQILHIAAIAAVFLTNLRYLPAPADHGNPFIAFYNNNAAVIYLIAMIFATYNAYYLIRNFKNTFFGGAGTCASFEKWYGIAERGIIVTLFFLKGKALLLLIPLLFARHILHKPCSKRFFICKHFTSPDEIAYSWVLAVASGLLFSFLAHRVP